MNNKKSRKPVLGIFWLAIAVISPSLSPASASVVIAQCNFNRVTPSGNQPLTVTTSICLGPSSCGCGSELTIESSTEPLFAGTWRPQYQSSPELYIVRAVDSGGGDLPLWLNISSTRSPTGNAAELNIYGASTQGVCRMTYTNFTELFSVTDCP